MVSVVKLGVLCTPESWYLGDLRRAAGAAHEVCAVDFARLGGRIGSRGAHARCGTTSLEQWDALLVRTMPPASLEQIVLRMDVLAECAAAGQVVLNPPKSLEIAIDKYLATARLRRAGLPVPDTIACQDWQDAMAAFHELGGDVVVKPLFGGEGRGITRISDEELASRAFRTLFQLQAVLYVQRFVAHHGFDVRLFVLGDRVWGMKRENQRDWRTNASRGAVTSPIEVSRAWHALALQAAAAVGAHFAGVDLLPGKDGCEYLLEVNAVPGWKALAPTLGLDVARLVLDYIDAQVARRG